MRRSCAFAAAAAGGPAWCLGGCHCAFGSAYAICHSRRRHSSWDPPSADVACLEPPESESEGQERAGRSELREGRITRIDPGVIGPCVRTEKAVGLIGCRFRAERIEDQGRGTEQEEREFNQPACALCGNEIVYVPRSSRTRLSSSAIRLRRRVVSSISGSSLFLCHVREVPMGTGGECGMTSTPDRRLHTRRGPSGWKKS